MRRLGLATAAAVLVLAAPAWAVSAPSVTTGRATGVGPTTATLNGTVNPNGSGTTYFFQYGRTTHYSAGTQATSAGSGTRGVHASAAIGGLAGNTTYHYRLVAFNSRGITRGSDRTFKTPPIPTVAQIAVGPNPVVFGNTFIVAGHISGQPPLGGQRVALEANPFPYTGGFHQVGNTELTTSNGSYSFTLAGAAFSRVKRFARGAINRSPIAAALPWLFDNRPSAASRGCAFRRWARQARQALSAE